MKPVTCSACKRIKTTQPFLVNGNLLCTLCVEEIAPRLVHRRAVANWRDFTNSNRSVPTARMTSWKRWPEKEDLHG